MNLLRLWIPLITCLLLAGCRDTRRESVKSWLLANPPPGLEVVQVPEDFSIAETPDGGETGVTVRYRAAAPTFEKFDALTLPRGVEVSKRLDAIRGWALSSLPAGEPLRETIVSAAAQARTPFPVRREVTPRGAEIEALVLLALRKNGDGWTVTPQSAPATVPGAPESQAAGIPVADAREIAAKSAELEATAARLEGMRTSWVENRRRVAEQSRAQLHQRLSTGRVFEGRLPDGRAARLVVSSASENGERAAVVLSIQGDAASSHARFSGAVVQEPSGRTIWRAAQVTTLTEANPDPLTDAARRPILTLQADGEGLSAELSVGGRPPQPIRFSSAGTRDVIPEPSAPDSAP